MQALFLHRNFPDLIKIGVASLLKICQNRYVNETN